MKIGMEMKMDMEQTQAIKSENLATPGPWTAQIDNYGRAKIVGPNRRSVATITSGTKRPVPEKQANARLISAAPEMLEALERVGCQFEFCPGPDKPLEAMATCYVCAAIRKAKGEKS